jgi:hypothetical protein
MNDSWGMDQGAEIIYEGEKLKFQLLSRPLTSADQKGACATSGMLQHRRGPSICCLPRLSGESNVMGVALRHGRSHTDNVRICSWAAYVRHLDSKASGSEGVYEGGEWSATDPSASRIWIHFVFSMGFQADKSIVNMFRTRGAFSLRNLHRLAFSLRTLHRLRRDIYAR